MFVGTVLDLKGNDGLAIEHRLAQATKVFHKWRPILQVPTAPLKTRLDLCCATVFSALLWLAETWHLTRRQLKRLESWAARIACRIRGAKKAPDEDLSDFWRRMHRDGHRILASAGGGMEVQFRKRLHRFAGHTARDEDGMPGQVLRTRGLQWWRECQARGIMLHSGRFHAWRWESQLEDFYGVSRSIFLDDDTGWRHLAQNRIQWKELERTFANKRC